MLGTEKTFQQACYRRECLPRPELAPVSAEPRSRAEGCDGPALFYFHGLFGLSERWTCEQ